MLGWLILVKLVHIRCHNYYNITFCQNTWIRRYWCTYVNIAYISTKYNINLSDFGMTMMYNDDDDYDDAAADADEKDADADDNEEEEEDDDDDDGDDGDVVADDISAT